MVIPTVTLIIGESRLCTMDFSALLARGETITSVSTVVVDVVTAPPLVRGTATYAGPLVQFRVSGCVSNTRYKIMVYAGTSLGNTVIGEGFLQAEGPPNFSITPAKGALALTGQ